MIYEIILEQACKRILQLKKFTRKVNFFQPCSHNYFSKAKTTKKTLREKQNRLVCISTQQNYHYYTQTYSINESNYQGSNTGLYVGSPFFRNQKPLYHCLSLKLRTMIHCLTYGWMRGEDITELLVYFTPLLSADIHQLC